MSTFGIVDGAGGMGTSAHRGMRRFRRAVGVALLLVAAACGDGGDSGGSGAGGGPVAGGGTGTGGGGAGGGTGGGGGGGGGGQATAFVALRQLTDVWPGPILPFGVTDDGAGGAWVADPQFRLVRRLDAQGRTVAVIDGTASNATPFAAPMGVAVDPLTGNLFVSDPASNIVQGFTPEGAWVRSIAGAPGKPLVSPFGLAVDAAGVLYVADAGNNLVRSFAPDGSEGVQIGAGPGTLNAPYGVHVDASGVYVADTGGNAVKKFNAAGALVLTIDGRVAGARALSAPAAVAVDAGGNIWIADTGNSLVQKFDASGGYLTRFDGVAAGDAGLSTPLGLALSAGGGVLVSDTGNGLVRRLDASGAAAGSGDAGPVRLSKPRGLSVDAAGRPWVVDTGNGLLVAYGPTGAVRTLGGAQGEALASPWAVAHAPGGIAWVAETGGHTVRKLDAQGRTLLTLNGTEGGGSSFVEPSGVALDAAGNVWVADSGNDLVRQYSALGAPLQSLDGLQSGARRLNRPRGVAVEPASGDLYIANTGANTVEVYSAAGLWRATWDGSTSGATPFRAPSAVTTGGSGRVFVADTGNDLVQVFGSDGHWSARIGGADEGGLALSAPSGLAIDTSGNLWVAESGASRVQVFAAASASPTASREAPKRITRLALPTPPNEFQFSGSVHYLARQINPNPYTEFVMHYEGSATWTLTYVYDTKVGAYVSDPSRSRVKGTRSKYYTSLQGGGTLCDQPAVLYDVGLLGTQQLSLVDLQNGTAMVPLTLPALLLAGCDTAGPGVILSSFNPPFAGINILPDFPTRALPDGWVAKFPASLLTTSASQLLWSDAYQGTGKLERVFSDGSKRIDIGEWTVTAQLSGVVPGAYVGLGDSFSAATGAPPTGPLPCLRSPQSYIELYDPRTPKNTIFAACSAATTDAITGSFKGNSAQASQIPYTADKVSITIGGNDAKLFSVLQTCVMMGALPLPCSTLRPTAIADARAITPKIQGALQAVKEAAPSARIGILEYPNPFPDNNTTGCLGLRNPKIPLLGVRALDVQFFHDLVAEVNNQVRAAAAATSVSFVPTAAAFVGHDMCAEPWFGPPSGGAETFHPNAAGNVAMKEALQSVLGMPN